MDKSPQLVAITLGSNIDKEHNLPAAVRLISRAAQVVDVSTVYESTAVGRSEQPDYFNAAILISTSRSAASLKDGLLSAIENDLGRRRTADKYAARTIDLDIALYGDKVLDYSPGDGRVRHVPDPDLLRYVHVAVPVAELRPDAIHPESGEKLSAIAARLMAEAGLEITNGFRPRPDIDLHLYLANDSLTP